MIEVKNPCLATCKLFLITLILCYASIYQIYLSGGYQEMEEGVGSVTPSLIGTLIDKHDQIWDAQRIAVPDPSPGSLFVTTNFVLTREQTQGLCPGARVDEYDRTRDERCPCNEPGKSTVHGVQAEPGQCVDGFCMLHAWCPVEADEPSREHILEGVKNFRLLLRANVRFPMHHFQQNNLDKHRATPGENIFTVQQLLEKAGTTYDAISLHGGIVAVLLDWACDLDFKDLDNNDVCKPKVSAYRLDRSDTFIKGTLLGYSFRRANYYYTNSTVLTRDLERRIGIQFIFITHGEAGKFDMATLTMNVGSALGLLTVATFAVDLMLVYYPFKNEEAQKAAKARYHDEKLWLLGGGRETQQDGGAGAGAGARSSDDV